MDHDPTIVLRVLALRWETMPFVGTGERQR